MADPKIHYIRLVGIKSKEALLIESFLNMAKTDQFAVKVDLAEQHDPKAIVVDELFHSDSLEDEYPDSKVVIIGDDVSYEADNYLHRPLKWSSFEEAVISSIAAAFKAELSSSPVIDSPSASIDQSSEYTQISEADKAELSSSPVIDSPSASIDQSSEYTQIAEAETDEGLSGLSEFDLEFEIKQFELESAAQIESGLDKEQDKPENQTEQVNTDSSVSQFSISQIAVKETNQLDQSSEYSESVSHSYSEIGTVIEEDVELVEMEHSRVKAERTLFEGGGLVLGPNIVFWENFDCLMTVRSRPVLYILSSMGNVYSEYNYLDWGLLLKSKYARVYPLPKDWTAQKKLTKYPLSWLVWFSSISRSKGYLLKSINKDDFFMLDSWPSFDQIYNDNDHLRLSSLLSTSPYSIQGLVGKTRLPIKVIVSYLNACEKQSLLKSFPTMEEALKVQKSILPPKAG